MNRRSFLLKSAMAAFGFSILPGAGRIWKVAIVDKEMKATEVRMSMAYLDANFNSLENWKWVYDGRPLRFRINHEKNIFEPVNSIEPETHHDPNYA